MSRLLEAFKKKKKKTERDKKDEISRRKLVDRFLYIPYID